MLDYKKSHYKALSFAIGINIGGEHMEIEKLLQEFDLYAKESQGQLKEIVARTVLKNHSPIFSHEIVL